VRFQNIDAGEFFSIGKHFCHSERSEESSSNDRGCPSRCIAPEKMLVSGNTLERLFPLLAVSILRFGSLRSE
jgi:hypothetical protein